MLVFNRRRGEVVVPEFGMTLAILKIRGNRIRIGMPAPDGADARRAEDGAPEQTRAADGGAASPRR